jgi:hypothetical protein
LYAWRWKTCNAHVAGALPLLQQIQDGIGLGLDVFGLLLGQDPGIIGPRRVVQGGTPDDPNCEKSSLAEIGSASARRTSTLTPNSRCNSAAVRALRVGSFSSAAALAVILMAGARHLP